MEEEFWPHNQRADFISFFFFIDTELLPALPPDDRAVKEYKKVCRQIEEIIENLRKADGMCL